MGNITSARQAARLSREAAALACGVSLCTFRRWERTTAPSWAVRHLAVLSGDLGLIDPDFTGWRLHNGQLFDPSGSPYSPGYILSFHFRQQQARAQRVRIHELEQEIDQYRELSAGFGKPANDERYRIF